MVVMTVMFGSYKNNLPRQNRIFKDSLGSSVGRVHPGIGKDSPATTIRDKNMTQPKNVYPNSFLITITQFDHVKLVLEDCPTPLYFYEVRDTDSSTPSIPFLVEYFFICLCPSRYCSPKSQE